MRYISDSCVATKCIASQLLSYFDVGLYLGLRSAGSMHAAPGTGLIRVWTIGLMLRGLL